MIRIELLPDLKVSRGKLTTGSGTAVHAATFLRAGHIILDRELARRPEELRRIFVHELFHFVWWRLGNPRRRSWEALLAAEFAQRARGELGWSAEIRKQRLTPLDLAARTRAWREYCCESFCDSGASQWLAGRSRDEVTLASRFRAKRGAWLGDIIRNEEDLVQFVDPENGRGGFVWLGGLRCLFPLAHRPRAIGHDSRRS